MDEATRQLKAALRREARQRREALGAEWRARASEAIRAGVLALPALQAPGVRHIAAFASVGAEIDTWPLIETLIQTRGGVLLPRVVPGEKHLEFRRVTDPRAGMRPAFQGIPEPDPAAWPETFEPESMDLILVPGLLYDRRGYRLGYGGGFYDRLLSLPRRCRAVGIVFGPLLRLEPLPLTPLDRPVDAILTESGLRLPVGR